MNSSSDSRLDVLLVGAGLNNCLLAWLLRRRRPDLRIAIFEASSEIPRGRTWSFHASDVGDCFSEVKDLISQTWPGYDVRFPSLSRGFESLYCSVRPEHLEMRLREVLGENLRFSAEVLSISKTTVQLQTGESVEAACVIDGRGQQVESAGSFQKFVGMHVRLAKPHRLTRPILMDAQVEQIDGYRFFYVLPWSPLELLIEDTRYSSDSHLFREIYEKEIRLYAEKQGWAFEEVLGVESGVLPIPLQAASDSFQAALAPKIGMSGGFFHPVTGYSLPDGVRVANRISALPVITADTVLEELDLYRRERRSMVSYFYLLNRMMFLAAEPEERYRVFEHFYRLPARSIEHFYAGRMSLIERLRLLTGRPPVPVWPAMQSVFTTLKGEAR